MLFPHLDFCVLLRLIALAGLRFAAPAFAKAPREGPAEPGRPTTTATLAWWQRADT